MLLLIARGVKGSSILMTQTSHQARQAGNNLFTVLIKALSYSYSLSASLPLTYMNILGRHPLLNHHSSLPRFPHRVYNFSGISCASSPLLHPPRSCLWTLVLRMMRRSRLCVRVCVITMYFSRCLGFLGFPPRFPSQTHAFSAASASCRASWPRRNPPKPY